MYGDERRYCQSSSTRENNNFGIEKVSVSNQVNVQTHTHTHIFDIPRIVTLCLFYQHYITAC